MLPDISFIWSFWRIEGVASFELAGVNVLTTRSLSPDFQSFVCESSEAFILQEIVISKVKCTPTPPVCNTHLNM